MSITIKIKQPERLFYALKKEVQTGKIKSWELDEDGHLTLIPDKYYKKAWFHPIVDSIKEEITFKYIRVKNSKENKVLYADYHSNLLHVLIVKYFKRLEIISAMIK